MTKVSRNDPCPCGSGRKHKQCCLRAAATTLPAVAPSLRIAEEHFRAGRAREAFAVYRAVLTAEPDNADALQGLGLLAHEIGDGETAAELLGRAVRVRPEDVVCRHQLGAALAALGRLDAAAAAFGAAVKLDPASAEAHNNLGSILARQGLTAEAAARFEAAVLLRPGYATAKENLARARFNLANGAKASGRPQDAANLYRAALEMAPGFAEAHTNLASVLAEQGDLAAAIEATRAALVLRPAFAEAHNNLGNLLRQAGDAAAAVAAYDEAIAQRPDFADAYANRGEALAELGCERAALASCLRALSLGETPERRAAFARCFLAAGPHESEAGLSALAERAVSECWARPDDLVPASLRLAALDPAIGAAVGRAAAAWPTLLPEEELLGPAGLAAVSRNRLLCAVLARAPVCDLAFERFLTMARAAVLHRAAAGCVAEPEVLTAACAISFQCFINEYVFSESEKERDLVDRLDAEVAYALDTGKEIPACAVVALCAYRPAFESPFAEHLLARSWPGPVEALLLQQIREPAEERRLRDEIPRLTGMASAVSARVREQYEANPYPRWTGISSPRSASRLEARVRCDLAAARGSAVTSAPEVLIAGCGTGREALEIAGQFPGARITAIDLSLSSLAYAARKSREYGIATIDYAQADLLEVRTLGRRFDVVVAVGVLHHLADPLAGWSELASALRPGGLMRLGLYSEQARQSVASARRFIAARGYTATASEIRRCRQDLLAEHGADLSRLTGFRDFFVTSECRDLLLHTEEHCFTVPRIADAIAQFGLRFLGFSLGRQVARAFAERFPEDAAATDLDRWHEFEQAFPGTFVGMYLFWLGKPA